MKTTQAERNQRKLENKTNYAIAKMFGAKDITQRNMFTVGIARLKNK